MLDKIIKFSLNNRLVVLVASVLLMIAGVYTAKNMEVDVFPDLNAPTVVIMTEAKGMVPEEVERLVTFPVETAINGATDVRRVRSSSTTGFSVVWVEFEWGTDIFKARQIVSEKLTVVQNDLPDNVENPTLGPQSSILGEVMIIGLQSDSTSLQELRALADWTIRPRLLATGGVAQVAVLGGDIKEYQILLHPERMKHYEVSMSEVMDAVKSMNQNATGGVLYEYGNEYLVQGIISTNNLEEISLSVIKSINNTPILLSQVAEVRIGNKEPKIGLASVKGKPAVLITVTKQPNTGTIELTEKIDMALEDLKRNLPDDIQISSDIFRQSRFIDSSINNVNSALIEGGIFVVIILFIFLMNVRTTLISLVTIPLSLVASILALKGMGLTINTMSLGGMAIAIGSLVDDAIVDVENVFKRLRENRLLPIQQQSPLLKVIYEASREVRMPILNSTLIIIASFVPLFFLSGMEGRMLAPLGIAFIIALAASTVVALTLTPVLCSFLLNSKSESSKKEPWVTFHLKRVYEKCLLWSLKYKKSIIAVTVVIFMVSLGLFFTLGRSFLPSFNEGSLTVNVNTLPGVSLEESDKIGNLAEKILLSIPEIKTTGRKTGRAELDEHALGVNVSEIEAPYELSDRTREEFVADVREQLNLIPGVSLEIGQPISHRIDAMLSGTQANIAIKIFGSDLHQLYEIANKIKGSIGGVDGLVDLNVEQQIDRPQLKIKPKRALLAKYGITLPQLSEQIEVLLAGTEVSSVYEGNQVYDLTVKVNPDHRTNMESIKNLMIDANGQKIPLEHVVDITSSTGPNTINRENVSRKIVVSANVEGRDLRGVVNDIQEKIKTDVPLPEGYSIEYGGQFESEQAASRILLLTSIFSIAVIYLLLYNEFKSAKQSFLILVNLPLALIGGILTLFFTGNDLSIPAIIGFISLFGIATRNGMLLVSRFNDLQQQGMSVIDSVIHGSTDRLAPILMTAFTSALALIPLAMGGSLPGNEIQSPMAQVLLGGLITSTLLNAFIVPIVYTMMGKKEKNTITLD